MAVALEFVNVIVQKSAVVCYFPGGLDGFARQQLSNLTEDEYLLRIGFMSGSEAFGFVSELEAAGLRSTELDAASDIAVVWNGSPVPSWLTVGTVDGNWACWASDHPKGELAWPEPGFMFLCPRSMYYSLPAMIHQCGAEIHEVTGAVEPGALAKLHCVRGEAEITIDVVECDGLFQIGLLGWRQLARRSQFRPDVALIRDLVMVLRNAGAED